MQAAKARGVTTSFDLIAPNEETLELLRPLLPSVDYFMPSLEEAAFLSGETQPEAIGRFFLALGVGTCILKDGENGSWLIGRDGGPQHIAPWPVEAVDTTGCGDSYCGGFIAALARGLSVKAACDVASAVAALVATELGAALWLQFAVFLIVSILALIATRPLARKMLDKTIVPTNADRVLHHEAKVTETVDNENATGAVYIDGKTWTARSEDGNIIPKGKMARIVRMEGVKLYVRESKEPSERRE